MPKPTAPTVPAPALRSQPDTFGSRVETNVTFLGTFNQYMSDVTDYAEEMGNALLLANLPSLTGMAYSVPMVNATEDAVTLFDTGVTGRAIMAAADGATVYGLLPVGSAAAEDATTGSDFSTNPTDLAFRGDVADYIETVEYRQQLDVTGLTTAEITWTGSPKVVRFWMDKIIPAVDAGTLEVRFTADGGSTWISTSTYTWHLHSGNWGTTNSILTRGYPDDHIELTGLIGNAVNEFGVNGEIFLHNPSDVAPTIITGVYVCDPGSGDTEHKNLQGTLRDVSAVNGIQFLYSNGNLGSGKITTEVKY